MDDNDNSTDIFVAAANGDLQTVTYLVNEKRVDVNSKVIGGETPLMKACANGHFNVIKFLVAKGANVNQTDKWGYNSLLWAVDRHAADLNTIKYLVKHSANINIKDKQKGYSPLLWVTQHGDLDMVKYLVEQGAHIDDATTEGKTAVHLAAAYSHDNLLDYFIDERGIHFDVFEAAEKGYTNAVKYFFERKKKAPTASDQNGWTVLHRAAYGGGLETVKYLVEEKRMNVNVSNSRRKTPATPLHAAAEKGHVDVASYLVEKGADVNARDFNGRTALYWATYNGHQELVSYFIDNLKGDSSDTDNFGRTLLHAACRNSTGNLKLVRFLVEEKRLDTNALDNDGRIPLIECIQHGKVDVFKYLIKQTITPVNIKLIDKSGSNALHYAAGKGYISAMKELIGKGGDYVLQNHKGQTPLDFASVNGHLETVKYLIDDLGVNYNEQIFSAAEKGYLGLVRYLLEVKARNADMADEHGWTPLHRAAYGGQLEVVKYFVEKVHVDVNAKHSRNGIPFTALHAASQTGHTEVAKYLAEKGADVNARDMNSRTPLYWAADNGFLEIVKYFVDVKKANAHQKDNYGNTLLHAAEWNGSLDVVKYLTEEKGLNVNERDDEGNTALLETVQRGKFNVFHYLLEERLADFRIPDKQERTCLHEAALRGYITIVKALVDRGADINVKEKNGRTPLYDAAGGTNESGGHLNVVRYFVDGKKTDVRQRDNYGNTLLHAAEWNGALDVVKYLVEEKGLDVNAKDNDGNTPLAECIQRGKLDVAKYLESKGARQDRRRRNVPVADLSSEVLAVSNYANRHYSIINCAAHFGRNIAKGGLISFSKSFNSIDVGIMKSSINLGFLSGFLMLMNVSYRKFFGSGGKRQKFKYTCSNPEMLLSPSQLIERRIDPNVTIAIHDLRDYFDIGSQPTDVWYPM